MNNVVNSMTKFEKMLREYPDERKHTYDFYYFFKSLSMVKSNSIPFIELGTILKHKKPIIYTNLRKFAKQNHIIEVITSSTMDLEDAMKKLTEIMDD
ncbi:hypothetical protein [Oceanobacillus salinisoli]|uniref:hypothetical protein n=1 Tax=Oceanobacillus salinisoli TaxID=2678611 RepID=UPI0012E0D689|nr:hypothetical protein [Oceanobacillus salinisoli]